MEVKTLNLKKYVSIIWPLIEHCTTKVVGKNGKPKLNKESIHIWYLYRQAFYGFSTLIDLKYYYSEKAHLKFLELTKTKKVEFKDLSDVRWENQTLFDTNREHLILEHMYTGSMFRADILALHNENLLSIDSVCDLVNSKYNICWILKDPENKTIHKTQRPGNIFEYYASCGIDIVNK